MSDVRGEVVGDEPSSGPMKKMTAAPQRLRLIGHPLSPSVLMPCLKFKEDEIATIAHRYQCPISETDLMGLKGIILERGHLTKDELSKVAYWKAPRSSGHAKKNADQYVSDITRFAFATNCERARIESLTLLDGVSWPTASVILHLFHRDPYPILDFRAVLVRIA